MNQSSEYSTVARYDPRKTQQRGTLSPFDTNRKNPIEGPKVSLPVQTTLNEESW